MPLISFDEMLQDALSRGYAVGYFEAWNQDSLESILEASEDVKSPVILGFGLAKTDERWFSEKGLEFFAALGRVAISKSKVPVCFILNEVKEYEQCIRGMGLGFNVIMMDTSYLPFRENVRITKQLVEIAHSRNICVEGEVGRLPESGKDELFSLTEPEEAEEFVRMTKVDALSVSIGNVHMLTKAKAKVDTRLLKEIKEATNIPLVIHGGTGFPQGAVKECIALGVAKFNVGTILKKVYFDGVRDGTSSVGENPEVQFVVGSRTDKDFAYEARKNIIEKVKEFLCFYGSAGKA